MDTVSYSELRRRLKAHMNGCATIARRCMSRVRTAAPVVMLSLAEYESLEETLHLPSDPANAEHVLRAIADADAGRLVGHDIEE